MTKKKQTQEKPKLKCPHCGQQSGDLHYPVLLVYEGSMHLGNNRDHFQFCMSCGWDNIPETRKMTRETYEYFWQRYRLMWGRTIKARPQTRGYHAPQHMVNFLRSFINPRWLEKHFYEADTWYRWAKKFHEEQFPNRSLFDFWEWRYDHPERTLKEFLEKRKEWAAQAEPPDYEPEYDGY